MDRRTEEHTHTNGQTNKRTELTNNLQCNEVPRTCWLPSQSVTKNNKKTIFHKTPFNMNSFVLNNKIQKSFSDFDNSYAKTQTMCDNSVKQSNRNSSSKMCNQSQSENIFTFVRNHETFDLDEDSFIERILSESLPIELQQGCGENFTQSFNKNSG
jgi:hypothetical protein